MLERRPREKGWASVAAGVARAHSPIDVVDDVVTMAVDDDVDADRAGMNSTCTGALTLTTAKRLSLQEKKTLFSKGNRRKRQKGPVGVKSISGKNECRDPVKKSIAITGMQL